MARNKFKMTGFARFFIVMLILAPLAYIGASYANGQDGIENIKKLFKGEFNFEKEAPKESNSEKELTKTVDIPTPVSETSTADQEAALNAKDDKIQSLVERNIKLQDELDLKNKELEEVKAQLEAIKAAVGGE